MQVSWNFEGDGKMWSAILTPTIFNAMQAL